MSVVRATSNAARYHWTRHQPTAAAGRLHTITSRELGPVAHARPPSIAYAPLSPYDRPLPCHQTRPANSSSTFPSFASDLEIDKDCALQPHHLATTTIIGFVHTACYPPCSFHTITSGSLGDETPLHQHSHSEGNHSFIPRPHACISARYTRLLLLLRYTVTASNLSLSSTYNLRLNV